jgi:hypothetical protein
MAESAHLLIIIFLVLTVAEIFDTQHAWKQVLNFHLFLLEKRQDRLGWNFAFQIFE